MAIACWCPSQFGEEIFPRCESDNSYLCRKWPKLDAPSLPKCLFLQYSYDDLLLSLAHRSFCCVLLPSYIPPIFCCQVPDVSYKYHKRSNNQTEYDTFWSSHQLFCLTLAQIRLHRCLFHTLSSDTSCLGLTLLENFPSDWYRFSPVAHLADRRTKISLCFFLGCTSASLEFSSSSLLSLSLS